MSQVTQLDRRRIEAELLIQTYHILCERMPEPEALDIIRETTSAAAVSAGQAFARTAPGGPSLIHFATVVDLWRAGGALDVTDGDLTDREFRPCVTRCSYAELYIKELGLSPELAAALSCSRDFAFAAGYSPRLTLERPSTIASGGSCCDFRFRWD
ncbi:L-2-amino-thiazoline-4-carboxylic acid hydrolase [Desulfocurvus sp. DL9XJH121]